MENSKWSRKALISWVALHSLLFASPAICQPATLAEQKSLVYIFYDAVDPNTGAKITKQGTGFVVSARGYVLTASHLFREWRKQSDVDKAKNPIMATLRDKPGFVTESPLVLNRIKIGDPDEEDVALLKLPDSGQGYPAAPICFSKADAAKGRDQLMAYGFPHDQHFQPLPATLGTQNAPGGRWAAASAFAEGMSGGPVYNQEGFVIGIIKGGLDINAVNWITPIRYANSYLGTAGFVEQCRLCAQGACLSPAAWHDADDKLKACIKELRSLDISNRKYLMPSVENYAKSPSPANWSLVQKDVRATEARVTAAVDAAINYDSELEGFLGPDLTELHRVLHSRAVLLTEIEGSPTPLSPTAIRSWQRTYSEYIKRLSAQIEVLMSKMQQKT